MERRPPERRPPERRKAIAVAGSIVLTLAAAAAALALNVGATTEPGSDVGTLGATTPAALQAPPTSIVDIVVPAPTGASGPVESVSDPSPAPTPTVVDGRGTRVDDGVVDRTDDHHDGVDDHGYEGADDDD